MLCFNNLFVVNQIYELLDSLQFFLSLLSLEIDTDILVHILNLLELILLLLFCLLFILFQNVRRDMFLNREVSRLSFTIDLLLVLAFTFLLLLLTFLRLRPL